MRVGVIARSPEPSVGGGYALEQDIIGALARGRSELGHRYSLCVSADVAAIASPLDTIRLDVEDRPTAASAAPQSLSRRVLRRLGVVGREADAPLRAQAADPEGAPDALLNLTQWVVPRLDFPVVQVIWDLQHRQQPMFPEVRTRGQWQEREALFARNLRTAAFIVTGTRAGQEQVERFYDVPAERIRVVPFPTPTDALEAAETAAHLSLSDAEHIVFYPAQFWPHKNHVTVLLALKILRERDGIRLAAMFTGKDYGNRRSVEEAARTLDLASDVTIRDFVPRAELLASYRRATALVFPTFFGPDNLPPLEAFALGCPVIASRVEGADEQLGSAALLFDPADEGALADALRRLLKEPGLRDRLVEAGIERARSWQAADWVRATDGVFDELSKYVRCWRFAARTETDHARPNRAQHLIADERQRRRG